MTKVLFNQSRRCVLAGLLGLTAGLFQLTSHAQPAADAMAQLALDVPIADVHMHLYPELTPEELLALMDRNKVRWGGAVDAFRPGIDREPFLKLLGERYVPGGGQSDYAAMYYRGGTSEMEDEQSPAFKKLLEKLDAEFEAKKIRGIGELILNNRNSHPDPRFRRRVDINAPPFRALYALAAKHGGFVQIHMEDDSSSIKGLESLIKIDPTVPVILSHCLNNASAATARELLEKYPNLYCETSARSSVLLWHPNFASFQIHNSNWTNPSWLALIEAMPDRFMVGSDVTSKAVSYDAVIATVRTGLLAKLSESTLKKVAYQNAQRVLKLGPVAP